MADNPPGEPIQAGDTLVFVVDILGVHIADEAAKGEPAPTEDDSLPYVSICPRSPKSWSLRVTRRIDSSRFLSSPVTAPR